ncbi:type II toxin-antitoxin system VapC family toxin [Nocardioides sp.]|uniref:type II toxin-antitoxin system VapC family toxin n=1 Tax=Nocardioides sp. TaxID=35761 RepID=UPI00286A9A34|nr:type II toxin-antitoxin system VapC family toxin [Nocardioides sp.]
MILDSSAIVAIVQGEPEARLFAHLIEGASTLQIAAPTFVETAVVLGRRRREGVDRLLTGFGVEVVPFALEHAEAARVAYSRYGKGSGSPARLNLGDCFSYALATVSGQPLLFKGDDFTHTDVVAAAPPT